MHVLSHFELFAKPVDRLLQEGFGTHCAQSFQEFMWSPQPHLRDPGELGPSRRAETTIDETNIDSFQGYFPRAPATFNLFCCD
jgi:hypothetical protein